MSTDDLRLEEALRDAAPTVDAHGVLERVTHRRIRRRRNHRIALGASVLVVVVALGAVTLALTRDDDASVPHVAAPSAELQARVVTGSAPVTGDAGTVVSPAHVPLNRDAGLLRAPMLGGATGLSVASDDPKGGPASHLVRVAGTRVIDVIDFKAKVLSIAEGEGARWALTQNPSGPGGTVPDTFLKRIPASGVAVSTQLPPGSDPVGPVAAVGGAVWVPVRDGVVQFDTSGTLVRHLPLQAADAWVVAFFGKGAVVTDGNTLRPIDPVNGLLGPVSTVTGRIVDVDARTGGLLVDHDGDVVLTSTGSEPGRTTTRLPAGFRARSFSSSPSRTAVTGSVDGAPAIVLLGDGALTSIVLEHATSDAALAWTGPDTVMAVAGGALYEIHLP